MKFPAYQETFIFILFKRYSKINYLLIIWFPSEKAVDLLLCYGANPEIEMIQEVIK